MRINPSQLMTNNALIQSANEFGQATYKNSKLPLRTFEAARIATALINGCMICKNWRTAVNAPEIGIDEGVVNNGDAPDEAFHQALLNNDEDLLNKKEKLAVEYAKGMGQNPQKLANDEDFWLRFKEVFDDEEIVDLTYCIAAWMGLGRVAHVLGSDNACKF